MSREYITTHARLNEVTLGNLGKMKRGTTYAQFEQKARQVASEKGVKNPLLVIAMTYKPEQNTAQLAIVSGGETTEIEMERSSREAVYPIADMEWDIFIADTPVYLSEEPDVHVVDGDLFTAPI